MPTTATDCWTAIDLGVSHLRGIDRATYGWLGIITGFVWRTIRRAEHEPKIRPVFARVEFFAPDAGHLLNQGTHAGIAHETLGLPVRNHLLVSSDQGGELRLIAGLLDGFLDSSLRRRRGIGHGGLCVVYKHICSTGPGGLQALLQRFRTKSFV